MEQQTDEVKSKKTDDEEIKKNSEEAQDKIDELFKLINSNVQVDSSLDKTFEILKDSVASSDKEWIHKSDKETREALFNKLRTETVTNNEFINRKGLSDSEVISNTSALSGRLLTNKARDFIEQRKAVLQTRPGINFKTPRLTQLDETKEFQSHVQRDQFDKCLSTSGWGTANGIAAAGTSGEYSLGLGGGYGYENQQHNECENVANRNETFFSRYLCSVVPTALWEPQIGDVSLSEDALLKLHDIEKYMSVQRNLAKTECERFFKEYGSHVFLGATHLGGIYKIETKFESDETVDMKITKEMVQNKHSESVNASFSIFGLFKIGAQHSLHSEKGKADMTGKFESTESSNVQTTESKVGGPQEVSSLPLWKLGLVANNSMWVVVDGGKINRDDYTPVWELVQRQSQDFKFPCDLIQFLLETWENLSGMAASKHDLQVCQINSMEDKLKTTIEHMIECSNSENGASSYENIVRDLYSQVFEMRNTIGKTNIWKNALQNNNSVSKFFKLMTKQDFSVDQETEVRRFTEKLLEFSDNVDFPHQQDLHLWMNERATISASMFTKKEVQNIDQFNDLVKESLKFYQVKLSERSKYVPPDFTYDLETIITSLVNELHKENDFDNMLYLYSHLIHLKFDVEEKYFKESVTISKLRHLSETLEQTIPQYHEQKGKGAKVLQAWILKGLLSRLVHDCSTEESDDCNQLDIASSVCSKVLQSLNSENVISNKSIKALTDLHCSGDIVELIKLLERIVEGKDDQHTNTLQWIYFEDKPAVCLSNANDDFLKKASNSKANELSDKGIRPDIPDLVKSLDLSDYFPSRLTVEKALTINNKSAKAACLKDLPWLILKQIMNGNFKFREQVLEDLKRINKVSATSGIAKNICDGNVLDMLDSGSDSETTDDSNSFDLHPLDVLLVLYRCCDPFLKGLVAQKIFSCQLAIPLIFKECLSNKSLVLSLWPLRGIVTTTNHTEESIVTQDTTIISFIRLGESSKISKSKFLNEILRDESETHNTFFHRDCKFGMNKRSVSDGMVEISWYLPSNDEESTHRKKESLSKQIREPITILNMRGDAVIYREQTDTITNMSRVVVVFVEIEDLKNDRHRELGDMLATIHGRDAFVIVVTRLDKDRNVTKTIIRDYRRITKLSTERTCMFSTYDFSQKREYNACEMKEKLLDVLLEELAKEKKSVTLETASKKVAGVLCCDETNENCIQGKKLATSIFSSIAEMEHTVSRKDTILPLQGECFWQKWSILQKETERSGKRLSDDRKDQIWKEMMGLREAQVIKLNSSPDIMARFIETLIRNIGRNETTMFFLAWLKRFLDDESRRILPRLRKRLHHAFHDKNKKSGNHMSHVEECKENLANASFGLEHFYRELGQIYEAFMYSNKTRINHLSRNTSCLLELLPYLAAKLLLLGQPLELMDGDAANVPQEWTNAVLEALGKLCGDRRVVSISVLGIQSSGKSTLLNTMFGLQFSVSAGRCTRGVFLQLLPICDESTGKEPSYVLIVDTEGLRAPESSGKDVIKDNELATLVIGLTDIVILNIKGETMGEMENVLQIVVHELLRLKQANANLDLSQSVIMVHQNVSANDASAHLEQGNLSIVTNLNKVTKEAASQACMPGIEFFTDVIQFNSKKHVKYISDLWLGNPPMAPINPRYCSQASEVVDAIFRDLVDHKHQFLSVANTSLHIRNLWKAILAEDFVFSFCNELQIKAYRLLDEEFRRKKWRLVEMKINWELENIKSRLKACKDEDEISGCFIELLEDFRKQLTSEKELVLKEMNEFLQNSDLKQHMIEWQENKKMRIKEIADELIGTVKRKIKVEKDQCIVALKQDTNLERRRNCIYEMATEIAKSLKGKKPSDEEKLHRFNAFWRKEVIEPHMEDPGEELPQVRSKKIKYDIQSLLTTEYGTWSHILKKELEKRSLRTQCKLYCLENSLNDCIKDEHFSAKGGKVKQFFKRGYEIVTRSEPAYTAMTTTVVNLILRDIDNSFEKLSQTDVDYDKTHFSKVLFTIKEAFSTHNKDDTRTFKLNSALEILVAVQAGHYACKIYEKLSSDYQDKHSFSKQLEAYRPIAKQLFEDILSSKTNEIIAANSLSLELKNMLREKIERLLPKDIEKKMRKRFGNEKHSLIRQVLEDLSSKNSFQPLYRYITRPETFIKEWLTAQTDKDVFGTVQKNSFYNSQVEFHLTALNDSIKSAVTKITEQLCDETGPGNIQNWIDIFKGLIKKENLIVKPNSFKDVSKCKISNLNDFASCVQQRLRLYERELIEEFETQDLKTIKWQEKTPYEVIFESLWGCTAKCPFCKEPCINSDSKHAQDQKDCHTCIQHRPSGIGGVHYDGTDILVLDSCSKMLQDDSPFLCGEWCHCSKRKKGDECKYAHKIREYRHYQPEWRILGNSDSPSSKFWAWCMVNYSEELADAYRRKSPTFPESWKCIKEKDALDSLDVYA